MAHILNEFDQPIGLPLDLTASVDPPSLEPMVGRRCTLVPLDAAVHGPGLHAVYAAAPDGRDWTYLPYGPFDTEAACIEFLTSVQGLDDPIFFTIIDAATGDPLGVASYLRVDPPGRVIEVGHIHYSRRLQGTALATEAMFLMMQRAFESGYRRYEWKCDALNAPSRAAAKRLGFTYEGEFRQATNYKGRNRDTAWFSIIDSEWPRIRAEFERWLDPANFDDSGAQRTPLGNT